MGMLKMTLVDEFVNLTNRGTGSSPKPDLLAVLDNDPQDLTKARRLEWVIVGATMGFGEVGEADYPHCKVFYGNKFMGRFTVVDSTSIEDFNISRDVRRFSGCLVALPGERIKVVLNDPSMVLDGMGNPEFRIYCCISEVG